MSGPGRDNGKNFEYLSDLSIDEPMVSFDLFDTVIQRRYLSAHEVHETVSAHACALLGRYGIDDPRALTKARYHTTNLMKASQSRPTQEPSVNAVWRRIIGAEIDDAATINAYVDQLVATELAIERDNLFVVEGAVEFIELLKSRNKVVVAVTDMYFSRQDLMGLLSHLGLLSLFDHLFVSADVGLTKQTGDLFALVARRVSVQPHDILHIGDNRISDHDNAKAAGLNAILIAHDTTLQRPSYGHRANIFREMADLNKVFLLDTLLLSRSQRVEHIYFLARDGCLMKGVLDRMAGPVVDSLLDGITYSELFLNRSATCWGSLDFGGDWLIQAIGLAFWLNGGRATADQLLATLGAPSGDGEFGGDLLDAGTDTIGLAHQIRLRDLDQEIRQALERKRSQLRDYLISIGFFAKRRVAFCDLGYSGSAARDLNAFLVQEEIDMPGLQTPVAYLNLIASNRNFERNSIASLPHVRFNEPILLTTDRLTDDLQHNFAWLELFFKHPTMQPVRSFKEIDGQVVPDLEHSAHPDHPVPSQQVLAVSAWGAEDIALLWLASQRSLESFVAPIVERFAAPDIETVLQVSQATYEADAVGGALRSALLIDPYLSKREIKEIALTNDYWIAGSIVASTAARDALVGEDAIAVPDIPDQSATVLRLPFDVARPFTSRHFDVHFYRAFYSDLAQFDDDFLLTHYLKHGRSEGRFPSADHLIGSLAKYGRLPTDFDPYVYVWLHADLRDRLPHPLHGYRHYLEHGQAERRGYSYSNPEVERDFSDMVADGSLVLTQKETYRLEHISAARVYFERFSVSYGGWIDLLVPAEFRLLNESWASAAKTKGHCLKLFLEGGIASCAPLSIVSAFIADDYRRYEPEARSLSDEDAYRHWLAIGFYLGRAPSEAAAIDRTIGMTSYPSAFDWKSFAATREVLKQADRVTVLAAFVQTVAVDQLTFVKGEGAPYLLFMLGNRALLAGRPHDAAICLEAGLAQGGPRALFLHRLGDAYRFADLPQRALSAFTEAVEEEGVSRWSFINGAELALAFGQLQLALHFVDRGRPRWDNLKPWRQVRDLVYGRCYELDVQEAAKKANRVAELKAAVERAVHRCEHDLPTSKPTSIITGTILVVTGRPFNSSRSVTRDGREIRIFLPQSLDEAHSELFDAATLIVHDLPVSYAVLNLVLAARRAGVDTVCFLGPLDTIDGIDLSAVAWQGAGRPGTALTLPLDPHYVCAASVFARIVTRFAALAGSLAAFAPGNPVQYRGVGPMPLAHLDPAAVMVVGGWRIDEQMRRRVIAGLKRWAETEAAVLVLDDSFDQDLARKQLSCRVEMVDLARHLDDVGALVKQVGALVEIGDGADFSFAAEAASAGVPSLSLAAQPGQKGIGPRPLDGLSASIGSMLAPWPVLAQRPSALPGLHEPKSVVGADTPASPSRAPTAPKVMLLNVYFPPQSIGGATRVLKDNLDFFLDAGENPDRFVVVTTDLGNDVPGEVLLDSYRGVRIYRLSTPQEVDMDWRSVNLNVAALMHRILRVEQPDLVHVHCVPRLSASSLDECRKAGIPYIITLHDAWWISDYPFLTDGGGLGKEPRQELVRQYYVARIGARESWSRGSMVRGLLTAARRRLAVSGPFAQVYRQCGIQCDVLENGVSHMGGPERPPATSDVVQLCHVGGLEHHKGAYILEIALKQLSCERLAVTVIDLGQDTGSEENLLWGTTPVRKIGRLPSTQMEEFYASMNVLIAPSTWPESFGLVTREAARLGLWVIASRLGAMGGGVVPGVNGFLIDVEGTAELMAALQQIDADPLRFQSPPDQPRMRTSSEQGRELLAIYRSIIG